MLSLSDPNYVHCQYANASNLNARLALHARFSTNPYGWFRWVFDRLLELPSQARVLEVGCGSGGVWMANLARIPSEWEITLTDLSEGMIAEAKQTLQSARRDIHFDRADVQAIPYSDNSFDAVIANHMLFHAPDVSRALSEIHRVLAPGGWLFAAANGGAHLCELAALIEQFAPGADVGVKAQLSSFSLENGGEQLARHFSLVRLERYEDGLAVTEVESLVAYVLSTGAKEAIQPRLVEFTALAQAQINSKGAFYITKDTGLFIATK